MTIAKILFVAAATLIGTVIAEAEPAEAMERGQEIYMDQCAVCHQPAGQGLPPAFPALADNEFVTGEPHPVIEVVLFGREAMPSFAHLPDQDIAAVITFIRNSWNNQAEPVSEEEVAEVRDPEAVPEMPEAELPQNWQEEGQQLFLSNCAACHQPTGEGVEGVFPALAGNPLVLGERPEVAEQLISIVLHGRGGMPRFSGLSDEQIAFILSYVRQEWENDAPPISPEMVGQVRAGEPLTAADDEEKEPVDEPEEEEANDEAIEDY